MAASNSDTEPKLLTHGMYGCTLTCKVGERTQAFAFEYEQWGAIKSRDLLLDIIEMVGEPLTAAVAKMSSLKGMSTEITPDLAGTVVGALMRNLKQDRVKVQDILEALTSDGVLCEKAPVNFDEAYRGKLQLMLKAAVAGFKVQYGDFSSAVLKPLGFSLPAKKQTTAASTSENSTAT